MDPLQAEEATPCALCGEPLIEGATGDRETRGSFHDVCIRWGRRWALSRSRQEPAPYRAARQRRRRS